jgi:hypothetical protein
MIVLFSASVRLLSKPPTDPLKLLTVSLTGCWSWCPVTLIGWLANVRLAQPPAQIASSMKRTQ